MIEINGFKFDISKEGAILRSYEGDELDIVIPDRVDGESVTKIGNEVFLKSKIKSVVIPETVTHIGAKAFDGCSKLTKVNLPNKIQTITNRCFAMCKSLETITIPEQTRLIEWDAFSSCSKLKTINWGESLQQIYDGGFGKCTSLIKLELPNGLTDISKSTFLGCKNLSEVHIPTSVNMIQEKAFAKCENLEIVIFEPRPEGMDGWLTTQTGCFAYTEKMRQNLLSSGKVMHDRVVSGFNRADEEKYRLDQIAVFGRLPQEEKNIFLEEWNQKISGVSKKGKNRLRNLVFLKSSAKEMNTYFNVGCHLELSELDEYLEYSIKNENTAETAILLEYKNKTFDSDYLEEVETRKEMIEIGLELPTLKELREKWTVRYTNYDITITGYKGKNTYEVIPESIDTGVPIRCLSTRRDVYETSSYNPIEKLVLPQNFEKTVGKCFNLATLKEIVLPDNLTVIFEEMFRDAHNLEKIELPKNTSIIRGYAFLKCVSLKEVCFTSQLKFIEQSAFESCTSIEEITLPKSLKKVNERAFADCEKLKRVILENDTIDIDPTAFEGCEKLEFIGTENGENMIDRFITKDN